MYFLFSFFYDLQNYTSISHHRDTTYDLNSLSFLFDAKKKLVDYLKNHLKPPLHQVFYNSRRPYKSFKIYGGGKGSLWDTLYTKGSKTKAKKDSTVEAMKKQYCSLCRLTSPKIGSVAKVRENSL